MTRTQPWAAEIRRTVVDFSAGQTPACFERAFERLLRDLKASEDPAARSV